MEILYVSESKETPFLQEISRTRVVGSEIQIDNKSITDDGEMRLAFFSKGDIFLECGEAIFEIKDSQGISLSETDCFGQLISTNFDKLFSECDHFRYNGSPVRFTVTFYNSNNQLLAKLISDSIFKNIGFGRGEGTWVKNK